MRPRLWCIEATVVAMESAGADIRPSWARGIDKFWGGPYLRVALNWQQMEEQDVNKKIMKVLSKKKTDHLQELKARAKDSLSTVTLNTL